MVGENGSGSPELVRVTRRTGMGRVVLLLVAVVSIGIVVSVGKPWVGPAAGGRPTAAPGTVAGRGPGASPSGGAAASHPNANPTRAATAPRRPAQTPPPTLAGLDLSVMGTADLHTGWGVAVAYVSRTQFANALVRGTPTVTPVVSWELIAPDVALPGPTLDHPGVTTVAIAATWPTDIRPVAVRLLDFGPPDAGSSPGLTAHPPAGRAVSLGDPVAPGAAIVPRRSAGHPRPGVFYLTARPVPFAMAGWPGHGWSGAIYAFEVELEGGRRVTLPFTIGTR